MKTITFKGETYPHFQSTGNAAKFAIPFAKEICIGAGVDIGYGNPEWMFPGVDIPCCGIERNKRCYEGKEIEFIGLDANNLMIPENSIDYVFSSHLLEHLPNWVDTLIYWTSRIKSGGHLFLYLPDVSQKYWSVWNNRKHIHSFYPELIKNYLNESGDYTRIFVSGVDSNNSFTAFAEKI